MTTKLKELKSGDCFRFTDHFDEYRVKYKNKNFIKFTDKLTGNIHQRFIKESGSILTIKH